MGYLHPMLASITFCLAAYVLYTGIVRFRSSYFHCPAPFPWKKHVLYGTIALALWFTLPFVGLFMANVLWGVYGVSGMHANVGLAMVPLVAFGYISGSIMNKTKQKRKWLPLIHGACNTLLVGLALAQAFSGRALLELLP